MRGKNLSARELAELSVTSSQTISAIRSGTRRRVRANLAARIEAVLGVERGELFVPSTVPAHESEVDIAEAAS
jgi:transcriptional regulator with XRE-family HTH domain